MPLNAIAEHQKRIDLVLVFRPSHNLVEVLLNRFRLLGHKLTHDDEQCRADAHKAQPEETRESIVLELILVEEKSFVAQKAGEDCVEERNSGAKHGLKA